MSSFARLWVKPLFTISLLPLLVVAHVVVAAVVAVGASTGQWRLAAAVGGGVAVLCAAFMLLLSYTSRQ